MVSPPPRPRRLSEISSHARSVAHLPEFRGRGLVHRVIPVLVGLTLAQIDQLDLDPVSDHGDQGRVDAADEGDELGIAPPIALRPYYLPTVFEFGQADHVELRRDPLPGQDLEADDLVVVELDLLRYPELPELLPLREVHLQEGLVRGRGIRHALVGPFFLLDPASLQGSASPSRPGRRSRSIPRISPSRGGRDGTRTGWGLSCTCIRGPRACRPRMRSAQVLPQWAPSDFDPGRSGVFPPGCRSEEGTRSGAAIPASAARYVPRTWRRSR